MTNLLACPHCDTQLFRATRDGSRMKLRTSIVVLHKSGDVEVNCPHCKHGVIIPLVPAPGPPVLKKADEPKLIVRLDRQGKNPS